MSTTMNLKVSDKQAWYKEPWPWIIMAGPAVVVVAGFITAWLAVVSNDGLVSDDYYKQGMTVNQRLHRDQQAATMGLHADVMRSGMGVRLLMAATADAKLPEILLLKFAHPTQAGQDQLVKMVSEGQGFYSGQMGGELSGRWIVSLEDPSGEWRLQGDWQAESSQALRLTPRAVN
jgi:hypothetical protein